MPFVGTEYLKHENGALLITLLFPAGQGSDKQYCLCTPSELGHCTLQPVQVEQQVEKQQDESSL